ncbi:transglycosylase domain-containing protein [Actinokineospora diospyrosa]|uniref:Membrane carboxypeptidase (Penicillin-binding protein) n=1 Tax=Actinokineospora diospyrosa TaxID=103728 RepID=A0ABT1IDQ7_9PSEU|nr:penicillin-binding protein [Actinokineospora diospyrosa]MCP2270681.1 Membrane carboxypeptidase (penicillin-binding protein) [Actinokineospora diospyrosa]
MRVGDSLLKLLGLCLLAGVLVAGMMFPIVGALGVASNRASDTIDSVSADLVSTPQPLITTITDSAGTPIASLYDQYRIPVTAEQISPTMKAALISVEDRRFYEHHGVDWKGTIRAAISNQSGGDVQGASTLTQQYVKNYLINVVNRDNKTEQSKAQEQTVARKLREARIAIQLEQKMSKEEILTGYLNVVEFAYEVYGIGAAASAYFGTSPDKLTVAQAALLAGAVNNPVLYNPWRKPTESLQRRNFVIDKMVENQKLSADVATAAKKEPLGILPTPKKPAANCVGAGPQYGFYCQYVFEYLAKLGFTDDQIKTGGYTIKTSFDAKATQMAKEAVEAEVPKTQPGIANTMAVVAPGKERHQVLALVANRDYGLDPGAGQTTYGLPSRIANKFGAGSIFKIFTAAAYLEKGGGINNIVDVPDTFTSNVFTGGGKTCPRTPAPNDGDTRLYCLKNGGKYPDKMPLTDALATSPNTAFVQLEERIGMAPVVDMASRLGLRDTMASSMGGVDPDPSRTEAEYRLSQNDFFKPSGNSAGKASFTLGPGPVSTLELANVAATLVSGGVWCPPSPLLEVLDRNGKAVDVNEQPCEQAIAEPLANTLVTGLSKDDQIAGGTSRLAAQAVGWDRPMMGKTGTTQEHKSAGFVGATPQYAAAVLTFNDSPKPQGICDYDPPRLCGTNGNIYGGKVPARTWFAMMKRYMEGVPRAELPLIDPRYVDGGPEIKVPDVINLSQEDATRTLQDAGYKVVVKDRNDARKKGTVVGQSPRGAALIGETITLQVSTGYVPPPRTTDPSIPPPGTTDIPGPGTGGGGGGGGTPGRPGNGGRPGDPTFTIIPPIP